MQEQIPLLENLMLSDIPKISEIAKQKPEKELKAPEPVPVYKPEPVEYKEPVKGAEFVIPKIQISEKAISVDEENTDEFLSRLLN